MRWWQRLLRRLRHSSLDLSLPRDSSHFHARDISLDFELGRELGRGACGVVREAVERKTGHLRAIKTIDKRGACGLSTDDDDAHNNNNDDKPNKLGWAKRRRDKIGSREARREALISLKAEIVALKSIHHPNVRRLYETYEDDRAFHMVTDLCAGGELFQRISGRGHLTEPEAAALTCQILSACEAIHAAGVCHRDIKPENLMFRTKRIPSETTTKIDGEGQRKEEEEERAMVDEGGEGAVMMKEWRDLVLVDFGMATRCGTKHMSDIIGTPYYIAPEVARGYYTQVTLSLSLSLPQRKRTEEEEDDHRTRIEKHLKLLLLIASDPQALFSSPLPPPLISFLSW